MTHPPFTTGNQETAGALGESRLIGRIRDWLGDVSPDTPFGIGDDCAVLPASKNPQLVTTDPVIFGRHFEAATPPRAVGAKLLKRNLSDIAAMGGLPRWAVVSLVMGADTTIGWLRDFHLGLAACARRFDVKIVGGDVAGGPEGFFGAFLTLHGEAAGERVLTRRGAEIGDSLWVTGRLGGSRRAHHYQFLPRLAEGAWLARQKGVAAMMDVSDGLAKDVWAITPVGAVAAVRADTIPVSAAARRVSAESGWPAWHHALTDGEDYELLFVVRAAADIRKLTAAWSNRFSTRLYRLGTFETKTGPEHVDWKSLHGFEHLC